MVCFHHHSSAVSPPPSPSAVCPPPALDSTLALIPWADMLNHSPGGVPGPVVVCNGVVPRRQTGENFHPLIQP